MSVTQTIPERRHSLTGFLPIFNRWKYLVLGLTICAAIVSAIVSLLLPNVYRSTTVFYPTNLNTVDPDHILDGQKIEVTASTGDIDRIITIGQSQPVAEYIINKYKLYKDYNVESMSDDGSKSYVYYEFNNNLNIVHTERDAIELTFFSEDKMKAAAIANDIVERIDLMNQQLTLENRKKVLAIYQNRFDFISKEFNNTRKQLSESRKKYGIYGLEMESRYLGKNIIKTQTDLAEAQGEFETLSKNLPASDPKVIAAKARLNGLEKAQASLINNTGRSAHNLELYTQGVEVVNELYNQYTNLQERFIDAKAEFENATLALTGKISSIYVVQKAYPATKKAKPVRWLIVAGSTLLTFMLSLIFIALFELYKKEMRRAAL